MSDINTVDCTRPDAETPAARLRLEQVAATLTQQRLGKYLGATNRDTAAALALYVSNEQTAAAFFVDLHYVEIALRNRLDAQLSRAFGMRWYQAGRFLSLIDERCQTILAHAHSAAVRGADPARIPPGKVIAELPFGFWHRLTASAFEHRLWTPYLHRAFLPHKAPKRARFNRQLETLRQLRNRIAHHEPIFHLDLVKTHETLTDVCSALCPATADLMLTNSTALRHMLLYAG